MSEALPPPSDGAPDPPPPKKGRKVRVDFRRNMGKVARDKGAWTRGYHAHKYQHEDTEADETVRAKGALSRKRTIIVDGPSADRATWMDGVVTAMRGMAIEVDGGSRKWLCSARRVLRSRLTAERQTIAVGDRVQFSPAATQKQTGETPVPQVPAMPGATGEAPVPQGPPVSQGEPVPPRAPVPQETPVPQKPAGSVSGDPDGVIEAVYPRKTTLVRQYEDRVQVLAANVDQAIIVASPLDPPLRPHLLDRFIVAAHKGDLRPVLCINKMDIDLADEGREAVDEVLGRYEALGYRVLRTSATSGLGIDTLRAELKDRTSVVIGMSGVGKSSLLNAVQPGMKLRTGDMDREGRGQHTTTTAELLKLAFGGYVVDTPGIRQFELAHIAANELESLFPEFVDLVAKCRYPDCKHLQETGCAIRAAMEAGEIHPERYDSFVRMLTQRMEET